jgi:hypothetical protein
MWTYYVGQKVICVDDTFTALRSFNEILPVKGTVYTVREILPEITADRGVGLRLVEIRNKKNHYQGGFLECRFVPRRFRPVCTSKTNISVFTAMLTNTKIEEPV